MVRTAISKCLCEPNVSYHQQRSTGSVVSPRFSAHFLTPVDSIITAVPMSGDLGLSPHAGRSAIRDNATSERGGLR